MKNQITQMENLLKSKLNKDLSYQDRKPRILGVDQFH